MEISTVHGNLYCTWKSLLYMVKQWLARCCSDVKKLVQHAMEISYGAFRCAARHLLIMLAKMELTVQPLL